jgi:hypothetical protein
LVAGVLAAASCGGVEKHDCNDGFDNDGDGLIDGADPGCELNGTAEVPDPIFPQCADGDDNDGDALTDYPQDPGCASEDDDDEYNEPLPAACADGIDNDGDGRIDYPNDPGCDLALEDDESDDCPDGPNCPDCSDGSDNDSDDLTDYPTDPGCGFAADGDEFNSTPGVCGPSVEVLPLPMDGIVEGDHLGGVPNELQSPECGGRGGESVYVITLSAPSSLFVTTAFPATTLDTVVYVRQECRNPDTELGCNDDTGPKVSTLLIPRAEPGVYYIVVDAFGPGSIGHFKLQVQTYLAEGEPCDPAADPSECPPGLVCRKELPTSPTETCVRPECDDGNDNDGDTKNDFPADPGCTGTEDNAETDDCPAGPTCPQCGNGADDDGDSLADFPADPGCKSASDNVELDECIPGVMVQEIPGGVATGTTIGGSMSFSASCDSDSSMSPEVVHGFRVTFPLSSLTFSTAGSTFANTLYVRKGMCDVGPDVACAANTTGTFEQTVTIPSPTVAENYFVFVDGDWSTSGAYTLQAFGKIPGGNPCTPTDTHFTCELGFACSVTTMTCVTATCNNGVDDDGDLLSDWPNDPGCTNLSDSAEDDDCPAGPLCPECGNDADDDGDSAIDYPADPGCISAADGGEIDECIPGVEVLDIDPEVGATGVTFGISNFFGSCSTSSSSPEDVYAYRLLMDLQSLTFSTLGSAIDTVTYVRLDTCDSAAAEVGCSDPGAGGETLTLTTPAIGTYFVFVDGNFATGAYTLDISGTIADGDPCNPASAAFRCQAGYLCHTTTHICVETGCNNGLDDDSDGKIDAFDPGCEGLLDDAEAPDPSPLPECADSVDNDGDSLIDYAADPGCARAADDLELDCTDADAVIEVTGPITSGTTAGKAHDFTPSCASSSIAADVVHTLQFPGNLTSLHVDTGGSGYDTVLYVKAAGCDGPDIACNDDSIGLQSSVNIGALTAGTVFIFVDGFSSSSGTYSLNINGVITTGQTCNPAQVTAGLLSCAAGTSCTDLGAGFKCQ